MKIFYKIPVILLFFISSSLLSQAARPSWVDREYKDTDTTLYFKSSVDECAAGEDARKIVNDNVYNDIANYFIVFIRSSVKITGEIYQGTKNDKIDTSSITNHNKEAEIYNELLASGIKIETHIESYTNENKQQKYRSWALAAVPRQKFEQDSSNYGKRVSENYAGLLTQQNTLYNAIKSYGDILDALDKNQLHKAVAYYDSPNGRVQLYSYAAQQLNMLASSVSFVSIPGLKVQKTDAIDTIVCLDSTSIKNLGPLVCAVNISGMNNSSSPVEYSVRADNTFPCKMSTGKLKSGNYLVELELLLKNVSPHVAQNPKSSFSLELLPVVVAGIEYRGMPLTGTEKIQIIQSIQSGLQGSQVISIGALRDGAQSQYSFRITINTIQLEKKINPELVMYEVTISFVHNGMIIVQDTKSFPVVKKNYGFNYDIIPFIKENKKFFKEVEASLENF